MQAGSASGIFAAVLAAGQSRRFGCADKLAQPLHGVPLGYHICDTIAALGFGNLAVIASKTDHLCTPGWQRRGFAVTVNERAEEGMGSSVAVAARLALDSGADGLLICLADMPFVSAAHISALIAAFRQSGGHAIIASADGNAALPPALFGPHEFAALANLEGEVGARKMLLRAEKIEAPRGTLRDIDTVTDLADANRSHL